MSKFAVFDIDGTVFRSSLYLEIAYELAADEVIELADTREEEWTSRKKGGYITYRNAVVNILEEQIAGMSVEAFDRAAARVVESQAEHVYVYSRQLIKRLKAEGYFLIAISGSQIQLVEKFASYWGFDTFVGQTYHEQCGRFTGEITKTHEGKGSFLARIIEDNKLTQKGSIAVGDTEGDVEILEMVERAIAFNPNRNLYKIAVQREWEIVVERKDMIYKLTPGHTRNYELIDTD